ncbi:hypothetical protein C0992_003037, partial [Termitomyces sp. T32_za158]
HTPHPPAPDPPSLSIQVGEDAYFIRGNALGVADGVGGWSKSTPRLPTLPSPSALFARRLMHFSASEFDDATDAVDVLGVLERAYHRTVQAHTTPAGAPLYCGSSTALIAYLASTPPAVHLAHVGDCMGMVVRNGEIVWRSDEMWWAWNTPVQLSPPVPLSSNSSSTPTSTPTPSPSPTPAPTPTPTPRTAARVFTVPVRPDDILILASDGLSDNLWDDDVLDEIARFRHTWARPPSSHLHRSTMAGMLSEALCSRARAVSQRRTAPENEYDTPFARRARHLGKDFSGGKKDGARRPLLPLLSSTHTPPQTSQY